MQFNNWKKTSSRTKVSWWMREAKWRGEDEYGSERVSERGPMSVCCISWEPWWLSWASRGGASSGARGSTSWCASARRWRRTLDTRSAWVSDRWSCRWSPWASATCRWPRTRRWSCRTCRAWRGRRALAVWPHVGWCRSCRSARCAWEGTRSCRLKTPTTTKTTRMVAMACRRRLSEKLAADVAVAVGWLVSADKDWAGIGRRSRSWSCRCYCCCCSSWRWSCRSSVGWSAAAGKVALERTSTGSRPMRRRRARRAAWRMATRRRSSPTAMSRRSTTSSMSWRPMARRTRPLRTSMASKTGSRRGCSCRCCCCWTNSCWLLDWDEWLLLNWIDRIA